MPFRFSSKSLFLTYAQCDLPPLDVLHILSATFNFVWIRVGRELHDDGNPHLHVCGLFTEKLDTGNERIFDIDGPDGRTFHPNIQSARSLQRTLAYVSKGDDYYDFGGVPPLQEEKRSRDDRYREAATGCQTWEEFYAAALRYFPRDLVLNYDRIRSWWDQTHVAPTPELRLRNFDEFTNVPQAANDWLQEVFAEVCFRARVDLPGQPLV